MRGYTKDFRNLLTFLINREEKIARVAAALNADTVKRMDGRTIQQCKVSPYYYAFYWLPPGNWSGNATDWLA